jgi:nucleoside-diphosphate-sugar epimerase
MHPSSSAQFLAYHGSWGLGMVVLRFGNVYGFTTDFTDYTDGMVAYSGKSVKSVLSVVGNCAHVCVD